MRAAGLDARRRELDVAGAAVAEMTLSSRPRAVRRWPRRPGAARDAGRAGDARALGALRARARARAAARRASALYWTARARVRLRARPGRRPSTRSSPRVFDGIADPADAARRSDGARRPIAARGADRRPRAGARAPPRRGRPPPAWPGRRPRRAARGAPSRCSPPRAPTSASPTSASTTLDAGRARAACARLMRRLDARHAAAPRAPRARPRARGEHLDVRATLPPQPAHRRRPRRARSHRRRRQRPRRLVAAAATSPARWSPTRARTSVPPGRRRAARAPRRSCSPRG